MKKFIIIAMAALAALSCSKEESVEVKVENTPLRYAFNVAEKPSFDADTKAAKTGWEDGDKIYIILDDVVPMDTENLNDFLILKYVASDNEWVVANESTTTVSPKTEGGSLDAFYYENPDPKCAYSGSYPDPGHEQFLFCPDVDDSGKYFYLVGNDIPYTVVDGSVEANVKMDFEPNKVRTYVQFRITDIEGDWLFNAGATEGDYTILTSAPRWVHINNGFGSYSPGGGYYSMRKCDDGYYIYVTTYLNEEGVTINLINNGNTYTKTFPKKISGKSAAITFKGPQLDEDGIPTNGWSVSSPYYDGEIDGHVYVDLGGDVLWATSNIGANYMNAPGDYFAWGEVEPYYSSLSPLTWKEGKEDGYVQSNYRFWDGTAYTKYNTTDGLTTLQPADDAATYNWGEKWRTPTIQELRWLMDNCTWEYWDSYNAFMVTSNVSGYEGKTIYMPTAGAFQGKESSFTGDADYWSSTIYSNPSNPDPDRAYVFIGGSTSSWVINRYVGMPIRPVANK